MDKFTKRTQMTVEEINKFFQENGIKTLRVEFLDLLGISRGKTVPVANVGGLLSEKSEGLTCSSAIMALAFDDDFVEVSFLPDKRDDMVIVPDFSTMEQLPYSPHVAIVQADLKYKDTPFEASPRVFLKKVVDEYHKLGLEPICACELEFFAFKKDDNGNMVTYVNEPCNCYTVNNRNDSNGLIEKISTTLCGMDFGYSGSNHEFIAGQYEFNWGHSSAVTAADRAVLFKTICKDLSHETDTKVTFMAKPAGVGGASGCHFHLSINDLETGKTLCSDPASPDGLSELIRNFSAGILEHGLAITPFMSPTVNCYKRYQPDSYAPTHIAWGDDNRTTYLRVPTARGKSTRVEARAASATCNPYLALGALLLAGLDGIKKKMTPPPMTDINIYNDAQFRSTLVELPARLPLAINITRDDEWMKTEFPNQVYELFLALKEREYQVFERSVTEWEMNTYFYHL